MTKFARFLMMFMVCGMLTGLAAGCGGGGGSEGDDNDPAATGVDEEQMTDETGDV